MMKKLLACLLAVILTVSAAACIQVDPKAAYVGDWTYSIDFKTLVEKSEESEEAMDAFKQLGLEEFVNSLNMKLNLSFTQDNKFTFAVDEASMTDAMTKFIDKMVEVLPDLLAQQMGMSVEDMKKSLEEAGMSLDSLVDQMKEMIDPSEMQTAIKEMSITGTYRVDGNKLYLTEEGKEENPDQYLIAEVKDNTLTITDVHGTEKIEEFKDLLPMVFTK